MPIEPATPPIFTISKFTIEIQAYNQFDSEYMFTINILPSDLIAGNTDSLYAFKIRTANNFLDEYIFYNDPHSTGTTGQYYYDLGNITANSSTLKLQNTKTISYILLNTFSKNGTTEHKEVAITRVYDNKISSGSLFCKLYNKKL